MPSSTARATARSRSAGAPRTMMPPTSPQPKASAETLSPVLPSVRYSIEVSMDGCPFTPRLPVRILSQALAAGRASYSRLLDARSSSAS